jgi:hypothetical protein
MPRVLLPALTCLLLLLAPSAAGAAQRYAAPDGSITSSTCQAGDPCRIDRAIHGAAVGDEVIITAGTYHVGVALRPGAQMDLHGDRDHASPRIIGDAGLNASLLTFRAGTLSHLSLETAAPGQRALELESGVADGLRLLSAAGSGALVASSSSGTVLRNTVVRTAGTSSGTIALKLTELGDDGTIQLRNLTVMATGGSATGIQCDVEDGGATLVNVLVRGAAADVAGDSEAECTAAYSNFRPLLSSGLTAGIGNQSADPLFADADYRPAAGSPTIDAGALDAFAVSPDPDGRPRTLGAAPDIGAYEYAGPSSGSPSGDEDDDPSGGMPENLRGVPLPVQGVSVVVAAARGTVRVRRPGRSRFAALDEPARVPIGSVIDARRGRVQLVSAIGTEGSVQVGLFWGSKFKARQRRRGNGMTTLALRGGNLASCDSRGSARPMAAASRKRKRKAKRSLWARDHDGKFRTHGNDSVATARGTAWVTHDRCDGTLTRVTDGAVSVRDLGRRRTVRVEAGHSYLARS